MSYPFAAILCVVGILGLLIALAAIGARNVYHKHQTENGRPTNKTVLDTVNIVSLVTWIVSLSTLAVGMGMFITVAVSR